MKTRRIMFRLFIAGAMILASAMCFGTGVPDDGLSSTAGIPEGPFGKYDPPITLEFINFWQSSDLDNYANLTEITGETIEDNRWTRLYRDDMGINITYKWYADPQEGGQKFKLAMASGDLPEIITLPAR